MSKINIVQIQTALLIPVTAQFITDKLGIKPVEAVKRAVFWNAADFTHICQGLIAHITAARNADFEKISGERPKKVEGEPAANNAAPAGGDAFSFGDETPPAGDADGFSFGDETPAAGDADGFSFGDEKPAEAEDAGFFA